MPLQDHEIPTVVVLDNGNDASKGISLNTVFEVTDSGETEIFTDYSLYKIDRSSLINSINEIITSNIKTSIIDFKLEVLNKVLSSFDINTLVSTLIALKNMSAEVLESEVYYTKYLQTVLFDIENQYRINLGKVPEHYDTEIDMYIWGTKLFGTKVDVFCTNEVYNRSLDVSVNQASGKIGKVPVDIINALEVVEFVYSDVANSCLSVKNIDVDINRGLGSIQVADVDLFSTKQGIGGPFPIDFKTRSLFTGDFFLERDRFTTASSEAWVDIVDYLYPIDTSKTYLAVNGTTVSGTWFEDITNGKRLYYNPSDDFYSDGVLTYTVHAESIIGEVEEKDFYLLYGYNVELNELIDWGYNEHVVVRLEAENLAFCPNKVAEAFDFTTLDLKSFNLSCKINPIGYVDLPATISPQSTVFYYGKTYTIKLKNVKDFAGNVMPDFEYTFTIENPNT